MLGRWDTLIVKRLMAMTCDERQKKIKCKQFDSGYERSTEDALVYCSFEGTMSSNPRISKVVILVHLQRDWPGPSEVTD